jgi:hypothetical protein
LAAWLPLDCSTGAPFAILRGLAPQRLIKRVSRADDCDGMSKVQLMSCG